MPEAVSAKVAAIGVQKAHMRLLPQWLLGMLAGAYIGFGAMCYMIVKADGTLGFALSQLLSGVAFSLGLILVVLAGAELFTGNNLLTVAWAQGKIRLAALLKNWIVVIAANCVGAALLAWLIYASGHTAMHGGQVAAAYVKVANAKCALPWQEALLRGVLCNMLVCLAIWLAYAGHTVVDKVAGIVLPIAAFVAAGFEHSVANMFVLTVGMLSKGDVSVAANALTLSGCVHNLVPVIIGNAIGGGVCIGLMYWAIYLRKRA